MDVFGPRNQRHLVVHYSGALGLHALAGVTAAGGIPGCLHPLQSFPSRSLEPERFRGIFCGVEGVDPLGALLERMVTVLGAQPFRLEGVDRTLYHAAAVFVSNQVISLASAAVRLWTLAGLPDHLGREALSPLLGGTAANGARLELGNALTGPQHQPITAPNGEQQLFLREGEDRRHGPV